jgi:hypothetical protein
MQVHKKSCNGQIFGCGCLSAGRQLTNNQLISHQLISNRLNSQQLTGFSAASSQVRGYLLTQICSEISCPDFFQL